MRPICIPEFGALDARISFTNATAVTISSSAMSLFGDKILIKNDPAATQSDENSSEQQTGFRSPRSILFLDSERKCIAQAAKTRGMNAAGSVRHDAVSFATDRFTTSSRAFLFEIMAQIARIYRGVYLLSTLKRDEILRDGRQEELEKITRDARESQVAIRDEASSRSMRQRREHPNDEGYDSRSERIACLGEPSHHYSWLSRSTTLAWRPRTAHDIWAGEMMIPGRHHTRAWTAPIRGLIRAAVIAVALLMPSSAIALDLVRGNQLTVCISTAFPPVAYSRDGELTGHDIAFLKAFAASRKLEIGFLVFPFDGLWLRPGRGECDIAASGITERAQRFSPGVGWSVPYYEVLRTVLIRAGDAVRLQKMSDFAGKTIGFVAGSTAELDTRARAPGSARLVVYSSARDGVADLLAGKIDGFAEGTISSDHFRAANPALAATPGYPMAGSRRELLGFPYRQASGIGPALDAWIRDNKASYGR